MGDLLRKNQWRRGFWAPIVTVAVALVVLGRLSGGRAQASESVHASSVISLRPGWNLVHSPRTSVRSWRRLGSTVSAATRSATVAAPLHSVAGLGLKIFVLGPTAGLVAVAVDAGGERRPGGFGAKPRQPASGLELGAKSRWTEWQSGDPSGGGQDSLWVWTDSAMTLSVSRTEGQGVLGSQEEEPWAVGGEARRLDTRDGLGLPAELGLRRIWRWDAEKQDYVSVSGEGLAAPGEGYWVWLRVPSTELQDAKNASTAVGDVLRLMPPKALTVTATAGSARLTWRPPVLYADRRVVEDQVSMRFVVYRDGVALAETKTHTYVDRAFELEGTVRYSVTALVSEPTGTASESVAAGPVVVAAPDSWSPPVLGAFETPGVLFQSHHPLALPKAAVTERGGVVYAHVAYAARGLGRENDKLQYLRSDQAGRPGSFGLLRTLGPSPGGEAIVDVAIAAQRERVLVAWVESPRDSDSGSSRLFAAESHDAGVSFSVPRMIRGDGPGKRNVSVGFDAYGDLHMVWGEGRKALYLKNGSGTPSSVFDVQGPPRTAERVRYKAHYPSTDGAPCACRDCWCEESYLLGESNSPDVSSNDRNHEIEAYVQEPSLHVGSDVVTVIARQTRVWNNTPVVNPAWTAMLDHPRYQDRIVQQQRPVRFVVGWRQTWKSAYDPGDEQRWPLLGFQYQYRYAGTMHDTNRIVVAQKPLHEGVWSQAPLLGVSKTQTRWRLSTVDADFGETVSDRPSHPALAARPSGQMIAVYEKGPSSNPNTPGHNQIHAAISDDGGQTWSVSGVPVGHGYMPQIGAITEDTWRTLYYAPAHDGGPQIVATQKVGEGDMVLTTISQRASAARRALEEPRCRR